MNIEEAEELLNATKLHIEWCTSDLEILKKHIQGIQNKTEEKKQLNDRYKLEFKIKKYTWRLEHLANTIEMMRLKASIPFLNY